MMDRRRFIFNVSAAVIVTSLSIKLLANHREYPLEDLLYKLKNLPAEKLQSSGSWNVSEIFQHLAQSVRYSRIGYPLQSSALFKYSVGSSAFNIFSAAGGMIHPLNEEIPGAPRLIKALPVGIALSDLIYEIEAFIFYQGELAPHFAYGHLSKLQYYNAHYLHIQNHLSEISLTS